MGSRLYTVAVIVAWLAAMTWLVSERILPPLTGDKAPRPGLSTQLEPVAWRIEMDGKPCGVAVLQAVRASGGTREVHTVLRIDRIESPDSIPIWIRSFARSINGMSFDMRTILMFDALDRLHSFKTRINSNSLGVPIRIDGKVRNDQLKLHLNVASLDRQFEHPWPSDADFGGELTPTTRLHRLHQGRRWTSEIYSPFADPTAPVEMIEAIVTERLRIIHGDKHVNAWLVEYRSFKKAGSSTKGRVRARLWVGDDGRVLRQETPVLGSKLVFIRETDEKAVPLASEMLELAQYATVYPPPGSVEAEHRSEPDLTSTDATDDTKGTKNRGPAAVGDPVAR